MQINKLFLSTTGCFRELSYLLFGITLDAFHFEQGNRFQRQQLRLTQHKVRLFLHHHQVLTGDYWLQITLVRWHLSVMVKLDEMNVYCESQTFWCQADPVFQVANYNSLQAVAMEMKCYASNCKKVFILQHKNNMSSYFGKPCTKLSWRCFLQSVGSLGLCSLKIKTSTFQRKNSSNKKQNKL